MSHSMKKRKYLAGLFLTAALLTFAGGRVSAEETGSGTVEIPVSQTFEIQNQGDAAPEDTFTYRLTAADGAAPMPSGSGEDGYTFQMAGDVEMTLPPVSYAHAGVYTYQVEQVVTEEKERYTYDREQYTVKVYVKNKGETLAGSIVVYDQNGEKEDSVHFENSWKGQGGKAAADPVGGKEKVRTGDHTQIVWYAALLAVSAAGVAFPLWKKKREQEKK